jgi:ribosomal protein L7Ae-like RNA K-turn-binding protein
VRIIAGPTGPVIDYRDKFFGRAAYVCVNAACIEKALSKENLSRALHLKIKPPEPSEFIAQLIMSIQDKMTSLLAMSAKAGKIAAGYSAVHDALEKHRAELLIFAEDISEGTKEKILQQGDDSLRRVTFFTRDQMGRMLNREFVGVAALLDKGFADAVWKEFERLKSLIKEQQ